MKYIRPLTHYSLGRKRKDEPARGILICEVERDSGVREIFRYDVRGWNKEDYEADLFRGTQYIKSKIFGPESFTDLLQQVYERGGSCDEAIVPLELAREAGWVGPWEYRWRRLVSWLRRLLGGTRRPSAPSGGPSALPAGGTERTE